MSHLDEKRLKESESDDAASTAGKMSPKVKGPSAFKGFFRIFSFGTPTMYALLAISLVAAVAAGVALAMVNVVMGQFIRLLGNVSSDGVSPGFMSAVSTTALYFVYIGIVRLVTIYLYASLMTYVAYHIVHNIQHAYLRAALSQEVGYYDQGVSGSISTQATSNGLLIQSGISEKLGLFVQSISTFTAAFVIAFISQWKLTLILAGIIPAIVLLVGGVGVFDATINAKLFKTYADAASYADNLFSGIRTVHAFSLQSRTLAKYDEYLRNALKLGKKKSKFVGILFGGQYFVMYAGMALSFWQGFDMIARGEADLGTVFTVLFSVIIAASTIIMMAPHFLTFGRAATAAIELFKLIDRESAIDAFDSSGLQPELVSGNIEIEAVKFVYPTRPDTTVLDDFTLLVPAGKVTALVGPSGSGKSTIIGLLERWYNPVSGAIKLGGQDINSLNLTWLRTNIRLVQQEPVLFNGTVFDNIAYGLVATAWQDDSQEQQMARVVSAAKMAFAHDFIMELPDGYHARVGERGGLLSGGQKQRIAIARSVISEPRILLLDEATSALDPHAEGVVQRALDSVSRDRTTIVIAHKLSTIRNADNIVVMSHGKISEQGTHAELLERHGIYSRLVKAQDLSPSNQLPTESDVASEGRENMQSTTVERAASLKKLSTAEERKLAMLSDREDPEKYQGDGLFSCVWRLARTTPELTVWYILAALACIGGGAVYPGQTLLLGKLVDILGVDDPRSKANFLSLMLLVLSLSCLACYYILGWAMNVIANTLSTKIRLDIMSSLLRQDLRFFDRPENTVGALSSRLDSNPQAILELMGINISFAIISAISVVACCVLSLVVAWKVGVIGVFVGLPPLLLSGWLRIKLETRLNAIISKAFLQSASLASETVLAIRTVSSLAIENSVLQRYTDELDAAIHSCTPPLFHVMLWFAFTQAIEQFVLALGFWWGSKLVNDGEITFYQFMVAFMGVYFSGMAAGTLFSFAGSFTRGIQAANYYFWLSSLEPTMAETDVNEVSGPLDGCKTYELKDLQFSYPLAPDHKILNGVSMNIRRGDFVAFVGASGCGKSTMISLLERFYDPTSGTISVDSHSLASFSPGRYRRHVALVQQEPSLFPGSIRENISHGSDSVNVSDADIESACRAANAWDFVSSLPEGLSTPCGTSGSQLSGGQRQRIAIARALIRQPSVILLDEATSALDTESERIVQSAIAEAATGNRITIAVAHRLSTIRQANRIFVFYGGRVVEAGTHEELIRMNGMYAKMCQAQNLSRAG